MSARQLPSSLRLVSAYFLRRSSASVITTSIFLEPNGGVISQNLFRFKPDRPKILCPVQHRSARAQADLTVTRARAGLVRARTALVNTARALAKSYGERLRGCNVRNMNPEKAEGLSPELQAALNGTVDRRDRVVE